MSDKVSDRKQSLLDRVDSIKDEIVGHFEELGLGKDEVLRVHAALDVARSAVGAVAARPAHDLNDDLAESPEDRPAVQGQESTPIQTDDPVVEGRERRAKEQEEDPVRKDSPRAPLPG